MELAQRPPRRLNDFTRLRGFPPGEEGTLGPPLLDALNAARALPEEQLPPPLSPSGPDETPRERALGDLLYGLGEVLCLERGLASELVLTKGEALALARGQAGRSAAVRLAGGSRRGGPVPSGTRHGSGQNLCDAGKPVCCTGFYPGGLILLKHAANCTEDDSARS